MQLGIVGIGLTIVAISGALAGVGHYDGVLGTATPSEVLDATSPISVTVRITITGAPIEAGTRVESLQDAVLVPDLLKERLGTAKYAPVEIQGLADAQAFMLVTDPAPPPGSVLVVRGSIHTFSPVYHTGNDALEAVPVVLLVPEKMHEPVFFKD